MLRKKIGAALLLGAVALGVVATAPAQAAPPAAQTVTAEVPAAKPITAEVRAQLATDCDLYMSPYQVLQLNDSWHCLGDWVNITVSSSPGTACQPNLTSVRTASKPAPNGWGNVTSSVANDTDKAVYFYDTNYCSGAYLFKMDARSYYDALPAAYNNKASSYKFGAGTQSLAADEPAVSPVAMTLAANKTHGTCNNEAAYNVFELNDSYYCLGPQKHMTQWAASTTGLCYNLSAPAFQDALHPAPNGWSNAISSFSNETLTVAVEFWDGFNCTNGFLWQTGPNGYKDRPDSTENNRASSIKLIKVA